MRIMLLLALAAGAMGLSGCAMMSAEDQQFYGRGWLNPKSLDEAPIRAPAHPDGAGTSRTAAAPEDSGDPILSGR